MRIRFLPPYIHLVKAMAFPGGHVADESDCEEEGASKNWCFWTWKGRRLDISPGKRFNSPILKISPGVCWCDYCWSLYLISLLIWKSNLAGKTFDAGGLCRDSDDLGWDGWWAIPTHVLCASGKFSDDRVPSRFGDLWVAKSLTLLVSRTELNRIVHFIYKYILLSIYPLR